MNFAKRAAELSGTIIAHRRYLHSHAELSFEEHETTAYLVGCLEELGIPVQTFEDVYKRQGVYCMNLFEKMFGTQSERELKLIYPIIDKIEKLRPEMMSFSDERLKDQTRIFKERLAAGETLDDILPEAFATVREAARRTLNMEHYPVQLIGGIVLHQGRIAEMRTGEGKTLVSTAPAYLNALTGKGVHIVTVNDYLAKRDAEWMGQVHEFLGLTVGVVLNPMNSDERRAAYACDITYVTNNELGFDYLRDNMAIYKEQMVLRDLQLSLIHIFKESAPHKLPHGRTAEPDQHADGILILPVGQKEETDPLCPGGEGLHRNRQRQRHPDGAGETVPPGASGCVSGGCLLYTSRCV